MPLRQTLVANCMCNSYLTKSWLLQTTSPSCICVILLLNRLKWPMSFYLLQLCLFRQYKPWVTFTNALTSAPLPQKLHVYAVNSTCYQRPWHSQTAAWWAKTYLVKTFSLGWNPKALFKCCVCLVVLMVLYRNISAPTQSVFSSTWMNICWKAFSLGWNWGLIWDIRPIE